ncbi:ribonuclease H1 domain-containing protein [Marinisporobacter balticus]|uniref:Ribonuclease H n=1 Tax=Marinisporobacter balticus TaxID=2018667 RepID=A0A4V2SBU4_9FIRM|nr:ribonuclease H family protein [Marinisporobacter balticus]TCO76860.1 ribonuclease HI [Marinisporobacter balticus]
MAKNKVYAVRKGRNRGLFNTWEACQKQIQGYSGAEYKSFKELEDAQRYMENAVKEKEAKTIENLNDDEMIAYVDGSYEDQMKSCSYGGITFFQGEKHVFSGREKDLKLLEMRNVAGEIKGARLAMAYAISKNAKTLYLYYDYEGIEKWATSAWQARKEGTKDYKKYYDGIAQNLEVVFIKVKAHSGDQYNEEVDQLAKDALYKQ